MTKKKKDGALTTLPTTETSLSQSIYIRNIVLLKTSVISRTLAKTKVDFFYTEMFYTRQIPDYPHDPVTIMSISLI